MSATVTAPLRPAAASGTALPQTSPSQTAAPRRAWWQSALHAVPNLVIFALLASVFYVGHHTGWKLPKMSELAGTTTVADDWCAEHLVPESKCIECEPNMVPMPKPTGFCREHGVYECVIHHPELAQLKKEPRLPKFDTVQAIGLLARPENNSRNTLHTRRVQFTSAASVEKSGIDVDVVQERAMTEAITCNGELMFDPTRVAHLSARVPGAVVSVLQTVGDPVQAGEILALVDAAAVGQVKSQLIQAMVQVQLKQSTVDRLRGITASGAVTGKSLIEAEAALQEAEVALVSARQGLSNLGFIGADDLTSKDPKQLSEELRFLGIPTSLTAKLPEGTATANLIPVRAPFTGMVLATQAVAGEVVDPTDKLFTIADPSQLWLVLNVRQEDAKYVKAGLPIEFQTDDGAAQVTGNVSWISPAMDEQTRTLKVRAIIANVDGKLRDKTFGTGRIVLRNEPNAIVVPRSAVQSTPDANFVFVRDKNYFTEGAPKFFHVRQVRLGAKDEQYVELLAGALPGEVIATTGSNVILAQLLRSNLGAGCCGND